MVTNAKTFLCPRCFASRLILVVKLLMGNQLTPMVWACGRCESLYDRHDLRVARRARYVS